MTRAIAITAIGVLLVPILFISAAVAVLTGSSDGDPDPIGLSDIPGDFLALYREAGLQFRVPFEIIAGIGKVECDHGRGGNCDTPNSAGAVGPMQFLPSTFDKYKDASGSTNPDINDPRDAIFAAAKMLSADGALTNPHDAIYAYNKAEWYVSEVLAYATSYGYVIADETLLRDAVLNHPNLEFRPVARADLLSGVVDERLQYVLLILATKYHLAQIGPFITGHSYYVEGTNRPSNHAFGRAVDIPVVNKSAVSPSNLAALGAATFVTSLSPPLRPDELGCPWALLTSHIRIITEGHDDHIHIGYDN